MQTINANLLKIYRSLYLPPAKVLSNYSITADRTIKKNGDVLYLEFWAYNIYRITDYFIFPVRMQCDFECFNSPYVKWLKILKQDFMQSINTKSRDVIMKMQKEQNCSLLHFNRVILLYQELFGDRKDIKSLDSSAGWGDRLIAAILFGCSEYVAYDPNKKLIPGHKEIIEYFIHNNLYGYYSPNECNTVITPKIWYTNFEKSYSHEYEYLNHFDICISSPPFFQKEIYSYNKGQSTLSYPNVSAWLINFLIPSFIKVLTFLKPGGYLCWYIEDMRNCTFVPTFLAKISHLTICKRVNNIGFNYKSTTAEQTHRYNTQERYFYVWQKL